jgi:hypothetical protein
MVVTLASTHLIFCFRGQKGEFVRIILMFSFVCEYNIFCGLQFLYTVTNYEVIHQNDCAYEPQKVLIWHCTCICLCKQCFIMRNITTLSTLCCYRLYHVTVTKISNGFIHMSLNFIYHHNRNISCNVKFIMETKCHLITDYPVS